jgi:hypothetical protein
MNSDSDDRARALASILARGIPCVFFVSWELASRANSLEPLEKMLDLRLRPKQILRLYYRTCGGSFNAMIDEIKALKPKRSPKHKRGKTLNA